MYLWCGKLSPLYGRDKMTTFERLFVEDPETHTETKNPYYRHVNDSKMHVPFWRSSGWIRPTATL